MNKTKSWTKRIILFAVILGLIGLGYWYFFGTKKQQFVTDTVRLGTIEDTVNESGNIQANRVDMFSPTDGVITNIYIENGDIVKAGKTLFKIKSTATPEEKASAFATYQSAATVYQQSLNTYTDKNATAQKVEDDVKGHDGDETFTQKATRTTAQVARDNSWDSITAARANLRSAELKYRSTLDTTAIAPINGTIANLGFSIGDKVYSVSTANSNNTSVISSIPVLAIGTSPDYVVIIQLNEIDINKIKIDQDAIITIDAIPGKNYLGKVVRADEYGTNNSGVISYNIYIKLIDVDPQIKPLMSANVTIQVAKHENVLLVPNSAVKPYKGAKAVQIIDGQDNPSQIKYVPVITGIKTSSQTEILSGVKQGDMVVTSASTTSTTTTIGGGGLFRAPKGN